MCGEPGHAFPPRLATVFHKLQRQYGVDVRAIGVEQTDIAAGLLTVQAAGFGVWDPACSSPCDWTL
jgi:hypothetical protein